MSGGRPTGWVGLGVQHLLILVDTAFCTPYDSSPPFPNDAKF